MKYEYIILLLLSTSFIKAFFNNLICEFIIGNRNNTLFLKFYDNVTIAIFLFFLFLFYLQPCNFM